MFWSYGTTAPLILPRSTLRSLPTQLCYCKTLQGQFVLTQYSWICGLILKCGQLTRAYILRESCLPLSQQLTIAISSTARGEIQCITSLSMLGFGAIWACTVFCAWCWNHHGFIRVAAMLLLCPEDALLESSIVSGSHIVSTTSSTMIPELWKRAMQYIVSF